jgi:hypothetical protein
MPLPFYFFIFVCMTYDPGNGLTLLTPQLQTSTSYSLATILLYKIQETLILMVGQGQAAYEPQRAGSAYLLPVSRRKMKNEENRRIHKPS